MRVVVDYGLPRPAPPPQLRLPGQGASIGERDTSVPGGKRREPVMIIHKGGSEPAESRTAGPGGDAGIPVPGTNYQLVTSEDALATSAEVRAHERDHQMALGPYAASGINYTTRRGPDGRQVVTGGSIKADLSPVPGDPRATLRKASAVRRAALAPADPSAADMRVAADAYRLAAQAKKELQAERIDVEA